MTVLSFSKPRFIAVLAAAALALTACGDGNSSAAADDGDHGALNVQLSWVKDIEFAGEYFADSKNYYTDAGFSSVNLVAGPGSTETQVASGKSLVGISDPITVAKAINNEQAPLKIISTTYQKNPFTILSLADKANITTPKDLAGKKIGVQTGNEGLFKAFLAANGITESEVTIVPVQYDPSVLTNGEVDGYLAFVTSESITLQQRDFKVQNLTFADNGLPFVTESFVVSQDSIDNKRAALKDFLYATIRGWKDAVADIDGSVDLAVNTYGKTLDLDAETQKLQATEANKLIQSDETATNGLLTISDTAIETSLATLKASGVEISSGDLFDTSIITEVYQDHPELLQ
ncbi:ABC-type nitrate/sulfonate/bicarbonate transport system substrate-binding protein [Actinoplanes lutulentus]|uniref:Thiamine pyrimidine synthase n=1 Tax=Actinoplanes lutulentus TaxID=1287878 RepID=A0A327YZA2_9ACTN|nr:ABC transporter substrate-binding protein [Actinoplanes lutulentus]MBB2946510.1 ABC-type nitrate/sulfonate/bicarbonate transport system substrate-binding protein [Actinoplanes lutulentus]RAK26428.1 ABC-type nitrate/sulfonate/bicarbonate transport system substrate-binding protein [Actinoplanes lutulentus]